MIILSLCVGPLVLQHDFPRRAWHSSKDPSSRVESISLTTSIREKEVDLKKARNVENHGRHSDLEQHMEKAFSADWGKVEPQIIR